MHMYGYIHIHFSSQYQIQNNKIHELNHETNI